MCFVSACLRTHQEAENSSKSLRLGEIAEGPGTALRCMEKLLRNDRSSVKEVAPV